MIHWWTRTKIFLMQYQLTKYSMLLKSVVMTSSEMCLMCEDKALEWAQSGCCAVPQQECRASEVLCCAVVLWAELNSVEQFWLPESGVSGGSRLMAFVCNYLPSVIIFNIFKYLSPSDRLRASATCKTWRECVLHASQWPHPRLVVDLTPKSKTTFHQLRRNKWYRKLRDSAHESQALKWFLHKCVRFVNHLVVTFDPNSSQSVNDLIDVIDILLTNQNLNHNTNHLEDNHCVHNWRSLRSLTLNPINVTKNIENNNENNTKLCHSFELLVERLDQLIQRCESLQHISMGCLQPVLNHSNRLLQSLAKRHSHSLRCLHLSSVKTNPDYYLVVDLPVQLLEPFASLKHLSIDFDSINDQILTALASKTKLETLVINVHGIDEQHEGLSRSAWTRLAASCPELKVTINLVHTDDSVEVLRDSLFDTDMPLTHFRSYFVGNTSDDTICYLVNLIANRHSKTLSSLTLVNSLKRNSQYGICPSSVFTELRENPLVMLAWRSRQLQSLTVIGKIVRTADVLANSGFRTFLCQ